jgi:hypothetical protein
MQDEVIATPMPPKRVPWNKGKLTGAKPPLRPKHVWSIRTKLQIKGRTRDLAMFNLAIDSKLCGCDVVARRLKYPGRADMLWPTLNRRFGLRGDVARRRARSRRPKTPSSALPLDCLAGSSLLRSDVEDQGSSRGP